MIWLGEETKRANSKYHVCQRGQHLSYVWSTAKVANHLGAQTNLGVSLTQYPSTQI